MSTQEFFATTGKGIEQVLADELVALGIKRVVAERGGVRFSGAMADCYRANLHLRTANRVLMPVLDFQCATPQELYDGVRNIDWLRWLTPDMTMAVDCTLRDSALTHSGFVALKTKDAVVDQIRDRYGRRPNVDTVEPDLRVNVHISRNRCTVSLDSSGTPLDRRGYRLGRTEAPLRENLAAALVMLTGWDGSIPLIDPMCGSGTIVIEAALLAARRAPGLLRRRFGFQKWHGYDATLWRKVTEEADGESLSSLPAQVIGRDRSRTSVRLAGENAERASVAGLLSLGEEEFERFVPPPAPGVALFNPPYGERLGDAETLKTLYRQIGDVMKHCWTGYTCWLLTGNLELAKHVGLKASRRIPVFNGPIECRLLKYDLY